MQGCKKQVIETIFFVLHTVKSRRTKSRNFHRLQWYQISGMYNFATIQLWQLFPQIAFGKIGQ
jgi:hypothetical protein